MFSFSFIVIIILNILVKGISAESFIVQKENVKYFPDDFRFGTATAAYQIEGGWNADGKGPSIWDILVHERPEIIADKSNADVGADSYHLFDSDLKLMQDLGLDFYRFSISWSRILPTGDISSLNRAGIAYYNNIIDNLKANNIEPMVTMYHWDLPQELQKIGGFTNPLIIRYFAEYANVLFQHFGDKVKYWITFNEPTDYCSDGYGDGSAAPLINLPGIGEYLCGDNTIKAHATVYTIYREKYLPIYNGKVGITISSRFYYSKSNNTSIVDRAMQFDLGWLAHPIFSKEGGYPKIMIDDIAENSIKEGRKWSRLPDMTRIWKPFIRGSADFLGLNYYTSRYVEIGDFPDPSKPSHTADSRIIMSVDPSWQRAKSTWLFNVPKGLGDLLRWVKKEYGDIEVIITENGWSDDGDMNDTDRVNYMNNHLKEVQKAIINDRCNVKGYAAWSLFDNFEWTKGYTEKFGMHSVNMTSPLKERSPKLSAAVYKNIIKTRTILD